MRHVYFSLVHVFYARYVLIKNRFRVQDLQFDSKCKIFNFGFTREQAIISRNEPTIVQWHTKWQQLHFNFIHTDWYSLIKNILFLDYSTDIETFLTIPKLFGFSHDKAGTCTYCLSKSIIKGYLVHVYNYNKQIHCCQCQKLTYSQ